MKTQHRLEIALLIKYEFLHNRSQIKNLSLILENNI